MAIAKETIPSFEKVNYLFRPRKQIERKIIIEILQELKGYSGFNNLQDHEYIGMGSIYYYDFILFHKFLDLEKLISIDDKITPKRFEFNKPYDFIQFHNQRSTKYLSSRSWNSNSIIWMDYDLELNDIVLEDFGILSQHCKGNDLLVFTIDAQGELDEDEKIAFNDQFSEYIEPEYKKEIFFEPLLYPKLLEHICINIFKERMLYEKLAFNKLFSFTYSDRAKMYTLGGIFCKPKNTPILQNQFIRINDEIIDIDIPLITYKEKHYLDSKIQMLQNEISNVESKLSDKNYDSNSDKEKIFVSKELNLKIELSLADIKSYVQFYKYYPQYYEGVI
ncbi:MAG: hypothetical protein FVQ77_06410 [Cytophagales bacterium]|nr:hypothetical protein [Cytophagales bacterium]